MKRLRRWLRRNRGTRPASRPTVLGLVRAAGATALVAAVLSAPSVAYYDHETWLSPTYQLPGCLSPQGEK